MLETIKKAQIPIYIYLHFHWDREWFMSFSTSRALLMDRTKKTLAALESGELPNFFLDGQAVVLEDLIEIEPDLFPRIKAAMAAGKLSAGPWYCLPDQSLIGGESLVRNLKIGMEITRKFGAPTMTGYNPDTFCHVQDLPRILRGTGISSALVLRGVPPLEATNVFWWESPDGSRVLTYLLNKGLTHPVFHRSADEKKIADDLLARWDLKAAVETTVPMLYSAGGEGMQPPGDLTRKLEKVNELLPENCHARVVSMDTFLADLERWAADKDLPVVAGDLRDNRSISEKFPAYVLDGVSSTRLYLKRDNAFAEHRLVRIAEPLFAMLHMQGIMTYPENELRYAWKLLMQNHPHDSICGCSIDIVHQEMQTRTQMLNTFMDGMDLIASENIAEQSGDDAPPHSILPTVTALQPGDPDNAFDRLLIYNTSGFNHQAPVKMTWLEDPDKKASKPKLQIQIAKETFHPNQLFQSAGGFYYRKVNRVEGWIFPENKIPGNGLTTLKWDGASAKKASVQPVDVSCSNASNVFELDNGSIKLKVDVDGVLSVSASSNGETREFTLGHEIVDVGDGGDTYNFDPLLNDKPRTAKFVSAKTGIKGPLVSSLIITCELDIPESLDSVEVTDESLEKGRSSTLIKHTIETEIALKKGVPILFFDTRFENHSADHRLSVRFNTRKGLKQTWAESHFSLAKQPISPVSPELPVPVGHEILPESYFSQRFFIADGQMILHRGLPEYRSFDDHVELTLVRSTSWLSRGRLRTRGGGAGPWDPTPEANCYGQNRCEYAWAFIGDTANDDLDGEQIIDAYKLADTFEGRLTGFVLGKFSGESSDSLLEISNSAIYMTAMFVDRGKLFVRLLNLLNQPQETAIAVSKRVKSACETNMLGDEHSQITVSSSGKTSTLNVQFKANELITLAIELA